MERMNFENVGRELERRGKAGDIKKLAESPDGQRVGRMVDAKALETAAKSGDSEALRSILSSVLNTAEGQRLAENVRRLMQD